MHKEDLRQLLQNAIRYSLCLPTHARHFLAEDGCYRAKHPADRASAAPLNRNLEEGSDRKVATNASHSGEPGARARTRDSSRQARLGSHSRLRLRERVRRWNGSPFLDCAQPIALKPEMVLRRSY